MENNVKMNNYKICSNCVMDTSDSRIQFDAKGLCDHCNDFYTNVKPNWNTDEKSRLELASIIEKIKIEGKGKEFDCILGLSGGVDSSYMLHIAVKEFGLRPLVFHVDGGWNSELAVHNIQMFQWIQQLKTWEKLGLKKCYFWIHQPESLHTVETMRLLQEIISDYK